MQLRGRVSVAGRECKDIRSDDTLDRKITKTQIDTFADHPEIDIVTGAFVRIAFEAQGLKIR